MKLKYLQINEKVSTELEWMKAKLVAFDSALSEMDLEDRAKFKQKLDQIVERKEAIGGRG